MAISVDPGVSHGGLLRSVRSSDSSLARIAGTCTPFAFQYPAGERGERNGWNPGNHLQGAPGLEQLGEHPE